MTTFLTYLQLGSIKPTYLCASQWESVQCKGRRKTRQSTCQ